MGAGAGKGGGVVQPPNNNAANRPGGGLFAQPPASTGTAPGTPPSGFSYAPGFNQATNTLTQGNTIGTAPSGGVLTQDASGGFKLLSPSGSGTTATFGSLQDAFNFMSSNPLDPTTGDYMAQPARAGGGMDFMQPASPAPMRSLGVSTDDPLHIQQREHDAAVAARGAGLPRQLPQTIPQTLPAQGGFNVNNAAATGLQQAMAGTMGAMTGPLQVGAFMNPYTQEVINRTQDDIERQRQMAINNVGAQAGRANAFGGSRQALMEGTTNAEYGRMAGDMAAQQRMAGYNTAMANAMADRSARLGAAGQLGGFANQAFNTGRTINQDLMNQGLLQQSLQQALIDSAATDMSNYANAPMNSLGAPLAALGAANMGQQTQTTTQNPGLLGTLGALKYVGLF